MAEPKVMTALQYTDKMTARLTRTENSLPIPPSTEAQHTGPAQAMWAPDQIDFVGALKDT